MDLFSSLEQLFSSSSSWLFGLLILTLIFLVLREFFCWYWKVNKIVELLEDIKENIASKNKPIQSFPNFQNNQTGSTIRDNKL
jgi:ABC-type uncharacterized transport system permease subunit